MLFMVEKAKPKLLFESCKCFCTKEKIVLGAYFCWRSSSPPPGYEQEVFPAPPGYEHGVISVNFDNFFDQR